MIDPTGAADTFAGGFIGYLARHLDAPWEGSVLRRAVAYGTALASFTVEGFGVEGMLVATPDAIHRRAAELRQLTDFELAPLALQP